MELSEVAESSNRNYSLLNETDCIICPMLQFLGILYHSNPQQLSKHHVDNNLCHLNKTGSSGSEFPSINSFHVRVSIKIGVPFLTNGFGHGTSHEHFHCRWIFPYKPNPMATETPHRSLKRSAHGLSRLRLQDVAHLVLRLGTRWWLEAKPKKRQKKSNRTIPNGLV